MTTKTRLSICRLGRNLLLIFYICLPIATIYSIRNLISLIRDKALTTQYAAFGIKVLIIIAILSAVFWAGIIMVYTTSVQLGIKHRVLGILLGWVPVANLIMLGIIISIVSKEISFEGKKLTLDKERAHLNICATRYPVLMVHGVFFRDFKHLNYWGRIPKALETNGARIFYGNHNSAASVANSGKELEQRIREIMAETGAQKVNVIAHSKGGLDTRAAISLYNMAPYIASLTTINTPHRGCEFADYLLNKIPQKQQNMVARTYNAAAEKLGDINPDFLAAVYDLTFENCKKFNEEVQDSPDVYYQSYGSRLDHAVSGKFPLNFTHPLVKYFDGANDGLVGEGSFAWGSHYELVTTPGVRGISHGDVIDLNRENIPGYDVREFYVQLVADLKNRGF